MIRNYLDLKKKTLESLIMSPGKKASPTSILSPPLSLNPSLDGRPRVPLFMVSKGFYDSSSSTKNQHAEVNIASHPTVPITHIDVFDFDGTLFRSPMPTREFWSSLLASEHIQVASNQRQIFSYQSSCRKRAASLCGRFMDTVSNGGLGWFQSVETLLSPATPLGAEHLDDTFLPDNSATHHVLSSSEGRLEPHFSLGERSATLSEHWFSPTVLPALQASACDPAHLTIVLTGRAETFRPLVEEVIRSIGVSPDDVHLKPFPRQGSPQASSRRKGNEPAVRTTLDMKFEYLLPIVQYFCFDSSSAIEDEDSDTPKSNSVNAKSPGSPVFITIYEDRVRHVQRFHEFLSSLDGSSCSIDVSSYLKSHTKKNLNVYSGKARFNFSVQHVTDGISVPLKSELELAMVSHLQHLNQVRFIDLCHKCCFPGHREHECQSEPNRYLQLIRDSKLHFSYRNT